MEFKLNISTWLWVLLNFLQIAFIALKLFNIITWSWLWVLSPLWIFMGLIYAFWLINSITILFIKISR